MSRSLTYFILFDLVVAGFIIASFKTSDPKRHTIPEDSKFSQSVDSAWTKATSYFQTFNNQSNLESSHTSPTAYHTQTSNTHAPVCITYGPLNLEQKSSLDVLLANNQISTNNIMMTKAPLYEVYWNLGSDKLQAINLFEVQKNEGALQDEKFKMTQDINGNWVVPISVISGNESLAKKMSIDLRKSSKTLGGKWQYRNKSEGYFYQFKDISIIPNHQIDIINRSLNVLKTAC